MARVELTPKDIEILEKAGYNPNPWSVGPNFFHAADAAVFLIPADSTIDLSTLNYHDNLLKKRDLLASSTGGKMLLVTEPVNRSLATDIDNRIRNEDLWSEEECKGIGTALRAGVKALEDQNLAKPDITAANCYLFQDQLAIKVGDLWTCVRATDFTLKQTTESLNKLLEQIGNAVSHEVEAHSPTHQDASGLLNNSPHHDHPPEGQFGWCRRCCAACLRWFRPSPRITPTQQPPNV